MTVSHSPVPARAQPRGATPAPRVERTRADACTMLLLGASGDLARRKLLPALYQLARERLLDDGFAVLGVSRDAHDDTSFREMALEALTSASDAAPLDDAAWRWLRERLYYHTGDAAESSHCRRLCERLEALEERLPPSNRNRLVYLAVPPSAFHPIVRELGEAGVLPRTEPESEGTWARIVVEKPFGRDLSSARQLDQQLLERIGEHQVYRIDHYLGKETVQNIMVLRFANAILEPLWNRHHIAQVQITVAESVGVQSRGRYYEEAGVLRDMFQNHLLQLMALTAMEPPSTMSAEAVRDEKVKVLRSIRWPDAATCPEGTVLAQYDSARNGAAVVPGYREEAHVKPESATPTYAALRLWIDNWRWAGVPFFLRSGKRLPRRVTEIAVQFRMPPQLMFRRATREEIEPNVLAIRVQPNEGVDLRFDVKAPGVALALTPEVEVAPVQMDFRYAEAFETRTAPAYETLLLDVMIGEATLFTRSDEVEAAWRVVEPIVQYAESGAAPLARYAAGTWGPAEADALIERDGFRWRAPA